MTQFSVRRLGGENLLPFYDNYLTRILRDRLKYPFTLTNTVYETNGAWSTLLGDFYK